MDLAGVYERRALWIEWLYGKHYVTQSCDLLSWIRTKGEPTTPSSSPIAEALIEADQKLSAIRPDQIEFSCVG